MIKHERLISKPFAYICLKPYENNLSSAFTQSKQPSQVRALMLNLGK